MGGIEEKIISMYAKRMTTRQISEMIDEIYGFEMSEGFISDVADKLLPEIEAAFPQPEYQRCFVHQVRNTLRYVPYKDRRAFANDLKTIDRAATEEVAIANLRQVKAKIGDEVPPNARGGTGM